MRVTRLLLCDFAQLTTEGKPNLLGIFETFVVTDVPANVAPFFVHAVLLVEENDDLVPGAPVEMGVRIVRNEVPALEATFKARFELTDNAVPGGIVPSANILLPCPTAHFTEVGEHELQVIVNSKVISSMKFQVARPGVSA